VKKLAIVPALNEERAIGGVIDEIKAFDPTFDVLVIDDGSHDNTAANAAAHGARVVRLPYNLGIGGSVQTGFRYAFTRGYDLVARVDGDGQHDPSQLSALMPVVLAGQADICVGSRFAGPGGYRSSGVRRIGIRILAGTVSLLTAQDYPHDYPEVEAAVMLHKHRLRLAEAPVTMRERAHGNSSITALRSVYYMTKVLLAVAVAMFRRRATPLEDA